MLSSNQQMLILMLRMQPLTKKEILLFKSEKSFYSTTGYLIRNGLIKCEYIGHGRKQKRYYLSGKGDTLAIILETLDDAHRKNFGSYIRKDESMTLEGLLLSAGRKKNVKNRR